jgi:hypothetical protein
MNVVVRTAGLKKNSLTGSGIQDIELELSTALRRPVRLTSTYGLKPGEGHMLRQYATEIGFAPKRWPQWLRSAR